MLVKEIIDRFAAFILLVCLSGFLLIIGMLIKLTSRGPVFFRQERAGLNGKPFLIYKFRTMLVNAEKMDGGYAAFEQDPRITKLGRFLRKSSLDELPQLINVLRGEMSLIGPRPTLMDQVEKYDNRKRKRLDMKPGITGWAQINGRNSLSWPEKIELDLWYVANWSIWLDLIILLKTIKVVVGSGDIYVKKTNCVRESKEMKM
ncbi:sugar transferase [Effusibacillus lacus]|uniref:Sugar transferase n=1 Tax=Effusibacillus lacus TaxID=1348429 RepID=A0A292YG54_9BACL|nr:sugar transferase [Effusibacillus lacus]TCS70816.1 exopolysaccharide biosynthesis polyprenyl glycosylphosphotransferase [Effusibacillus lacus]GAX89387.1 sugar transferase [Effusibacillus lacus]